MSDAHDAANFENPDLSPDPSWVLKDIGRDGRRNRSFVSGDPYGSRLRVRYYWDPVADARVAKVWFGPDAEGPPGHAHGGSVAAVLDEAMGTNAWLRGHHVLAGTLTIRYRRPVPLGVVHVVRTSIARIEGRKIFAEGTIEGPDGAVVAEGEGLFIEMKPELRAAMKDAADRTGRVTPDAY